MDIFGTLTTILAFIVVLGIVVFVHEYGHYIVGRWRGIRAEVFSIGFGPSLYGWTDSRGTRWQVAALPLGGFVKFVGDMDPASAGHAKDDDLAPGDRAAAFHNASLTSRALTVAAGPVFNFALSILLFVVVGLAVGRPSDEPVIGEIDRDVPGLSLMELEPGDRVLEAAGRPVQTFSEVAEAIRDSDGAPVSFLVDRGGERLTASVERQVSAEVIAVSPGEAASRAGIAPGDRVVSVAGEPVADFHDIVMVVAGLTPGEEIEVVVERGDGRRSFTLAPGSSVRPHPVTGEMAEQALLGIQAHGIRSIGPTYEAANPLDVAAGAVLRTVGIVTTSLSYMGDLIFASADTSQLGGPIRIAQMSGEQAEKGFLEFLTLIAVLSTSIGLINLFPIPVLDGGHLMFYAAEALRGRPVGERAIRYGTMLGLSLVLLLMVFATYNDLTRL